MRSPRSFLRERAVNASRGPFLSEVIRLRFILVTLGLVALNTALSVSPFVRSAGLAGLDLLQLVRYSHASHSVIVGIGSEDYRIHFGSASPLNPEKLMEALTAIDRHGPAVIVVDIDTSARSFCSASVPVVKAPLVWARDAAQNGSGALTEGDVLGGCGELPKRVGLSVFHYDRDNTVRHAVRQFDAYRSRQASLPWATVLAYRGQDPDTDGGYDARIIRAHLGLEPFIPLDDVLQAAHPGQDNPLRGKIVLLGGYYGGDDHPTPFGRVSGVHIVADAIESELQHSGIREVPDGIRLLFEILIAVLVAAIHHYLMPKYAALTTLMLAVFSVFGSIIAFLWGGFWMSFVVVVVGLWIEESYEGTVHAQYLAEKLRTLTST